MSTSAETNPQVFIMIDEYHEILTLSYYNDALNEAYFEFGNKEEAIIAAVEDIQHSNFADAFNHLVQNDYMVISGYNETLPPDDVEESLAFYEKVITNSYEESGSKDTAISEATETLLNSDFRLTFKFVIDNSPELIYAIDETFPDDIYE
jgi:hypothetical protein